MEGRGATRARRRSPRCGPPARISLSLVDDLTTYPNLVPDVLHPINGLRVDPTGLRDDSAQHLAWLCRHTKIDRVSLLETEHWVSRI